MIIEILCSTITRLILIVISPLIVILMLNIAILTNLTISEIVFMYIFGLVLPINWIVYVPAIIFIPIIMNKIKKKKEFIEIRLFKLLLFSIFIGAFLGFLVFLPIGIVAIIANPTSLIIYSWLFLALCGAVAGSFSLPLIAFLYKWSLNLNKGVKSEGQVCP